MPVKNKDELLLSKLKKVCSPVLHKVYPKEMYSKNKRYYVIQKTFKFKNITESLTEYIGQKEGDKITTLVDLERNEIVMSDSSMELITNLRVTSEKGDILLGGLGLGLIPMTLLLNDPTTNIDIIELDQELADLTEPIIRKVAPTLGQIHIASVFDFEPTKKYDVIYMDIWNYTTAENLEEMITLSKKYRKYLKPNGKMYCWRFTETLLDYITSNDFQFPKGLKLKSIHGDIIDTKTFIAGVVPLLCTPFKLMPDILELEVL